MTPMPTAAPSKAPARAPAAPIATAAKRVGALALLALVAGCGSLPGGGSPMSFFITSTNPGQGGNLGGLAGADAHCQKLAAAAGAGHRTWRAYLGTHSANGGATVHPRDRIGRGPFVNAKGEVIALNVAELHGPSNNLNKRTALTEKGEVVPGRGDPRNDHDILTGAREDGTAAEQTCRNWTSGTDGNAIVGHHDRMGLNTLPPALSWNASHPSRGCSLDALRQSGGAGLFYCMAVN